MKRTYHTFKPKTELSTETRKPFLLKLTICNTDSYLIEKDEVYLASKYLTLRKRNPFKN